MHKYQPGDIIRAKSFTDCMRYDYFHVTYADLCGALDVVGDWDGKRYGLSANYSRNEPATLAQLVEHWETFGRSK